MLDTLGKAPCKYYDLLVYFYFNDKRIDDFVSKFKELDEVGKYLVLHKAWKLDFNEKANNKLIDEGYIFFLSDVIIAEGTFCAYELHCCSEELELMLQNKSTIVPKEKLDYWGNKKDSLSDKAEKILKEHERILDYFSKLNS